MVSKYESMARKELRDQGWTIEWKARPARIMRSYSVDFFGLFDIMAYRIGDPIRFIQIKSAKSGGVSEIRRRIKDFWLPEGNVQKELWIYYPDKKEGRRMKVKREML